MQVKIEGIRLTSKPADSKSAVEGAEPSFPAILRSSYATSRGHKSSAGLHQPALSWPRGQEVKPPPFHGGVPGSNPGGVTKKEIRFS